MLWLSVYLLGLDERKYCWYYGPDDWTSACDCQMISLTGSCRDVNQSTVVGSYTSYFQYVDANTLKVNETQLTDRIQALERRNQELEERVDNLTSTVERLIEELSKRCLTNAKGASLTQLRGLCSIVAL